MTQPASKRLVSEARLSDITTAATNAGIASAQSQINSSAAAAASSATAAQNSANLVGAPADTAIATAVNGSGTQTRGALDGRYAPKGYAHTVILAEDSSGTHTTIASAFAALASGGRILIKPRAGGVAWAPTGPITLPNVDSVTVQGWGRAAVGIQFPAGDGFIFDGTRRNAEWRWENLRIVGTGVDANSRGINGTGLHISDRAFLSSLQIINFNTALFATGATGGAHYTRLDHLRISNCTVGLTATAGTGSCNGWTITGGEFSACGTGIKISDTIIDAWTVFGTGFEGCSQAIDWNASRSTFQAIRLETNTADVKFNTSANYNHLRTGFFNLAKHSDVSTQNTNVVDLHGFSTFFSPATTEILNTVPPGVCNVGITPTAAGAAMVVTVKPQRLMKLSSISFAVTTSAGNVDVAVYDNNVTQLATSGSTAMAAVNTVQTVALPAPLWLMPGQRYYIAVAFDTATAAILGFTSAQVATYLANAIDNSSKTKATMFPLSGKTLAGMSSTGSTPWIRCA